jgi:hypothetical protein
MIGQKEPSSEFWGGATPADATFQSAQSADICIRKRPFKYGIQPEMEPHFSDSINSMGFFQIARHIGWEF